MMMMMMFLLLYTTHIKMIFLATILHKSGVMMNEQNTVSNMVYKLWKLITNIIKGAPGMLLWTVWKVAVGCCKSAWWVVKMAGLVVWKVVVGCCKSAGWVVKMAGLVVWRSFWWSIGACLRRGCKVEAVKEVAMEEDVAAVVEAVRRPTQARPAQVVRKQREQKSRLRVVYDGGSSSGGAADSSDSDTVQPRQLVGRRGIGSTIVSKSSGESWGFVTGESGTSWKMSTGRYVVKRLMGKSWEWKSVVHKKDVRPIGRCHEPKKITCKTAEEAVELLMRHQTSGDQGRVEISIEA